MENQKNKEKTIKMLVEKEQNRKKSVFFPFSFYDGSSLFSFFFNTGKKHGFVGLSPEQEGVGRNMISQCYSEFSHRKEGRSLGMTSLAVRPVQCYSRSIQVALSHSHAQDLPLLSSLHIHTNFK